MWELHGTEMGSFFELILAAHAIEMDSFGRKITRRITRKRNENFIVASRMKVHHVDRSWRATSASHWTFCFMMVCYWSNLQANFSCFIMNSDAIVSARSLGASLDIAYSSPLRCFFFGEADVDVDLGPITITGVSRKVEFLLKIPLKCASIKRVTFMRLDTYTRFDSRSKRQNNCLDDAGFTSARCRNV